MTPPTHPKPVDADVVIIGAGPVGLSLANLLGVYGTSVIVLEQADELIDTPRAVVLDDEALRMWQAAGIAGELIHDIHLPQAGETLLSYRDADDREFMRIAPRENDFGYPKIAAFVQPMADRVLLKALKRFDAADVRFGHRVTGLTEHDDRVLASGLANGTPFEVWARFAIGCDGGRSETRRALGISMEGSTQPERWLVLDVVEEEYPERALEMGAVIWSIPERPAVTVPRKYGHRRWEFMLHADDDERQVLDDAVFDEFIRRHGKTDYSVIRKLVYTFNGRIASSYGKGRIYVAGDAAHVTPPFAGQGLSSGLRDAFNLGWKLAMAANGSARIGLLETYEAERRVHAAAMIKLATRLGRVMMPRSRLQAFLTKTLIRAAQLAPSVRRQVREFKARSLPTLETGIIGRDDSARKLVGRYFPQPRVKLSDGSTPPLDEMLGTGFSIISPVQIAPWAIDPIASLAPKIVRVWPPGATPANNGDVEDVTGRLWELIGDRKLTILVRPDRFVAFAVELDHLTEACRDIAAKLQLAGQAAR